MNKKLLNLPKLPLNRFPAPGKTDGGGGRCICATFGFKLEGCVGEAKSGVDAGGGIIVGGGIIGSLSTAAPECAGISSSKLETEAGDAIDTGDCSTGDCSADSWSTSRWRSNICEVAGGGDAGLAEWIGEDAPLASVDSTSEGARVTGCSSLGYNFIKHIKNSEQMYQIESINDYIVDA